MKQFAKMSAFGLVALSLFSVNAGAAEPERRRGDGADVRGVVTDENKKAVADATVRLLHRGSDDKLHEVDSDSTNDDGGFRFTDVGDGTYIVTAYSGRNKQLRDRTTVTIKRGRAVEPIAFALRRGEEVADERDAKRSSDARYSNLKGTVRDRNGDPLRNAKVRLGSRDEQRDREKEIEVIETDTKGRFEFYKVVNGTYFVEVADDRKGSRKSVVLRDDNKTERVDLTVR